MTSRHDNDGIVGLGGYQQGCALVGREFDPEGKGPTGFYPSRIEHEFFFFSELRPSSLFPSPL